MTNGREVVILSGARTPIGKYGGALKDVRPTELGAVAAREAIRRAGIDATEVEQLVFGNVIHTESRDMYFARVVGRPRRRGSSAHGESTVWKWPAGRSVCCSGDSCRQRGRWCRRWS